MRRNRKLERLLAIKHPIHRTIIICLIIMAASTLQQCRVITVAEMVGSVLATAVYNTAIICYGLRMRKRRQDIVDRWFDRKRRMYDDKYNKAG